MKAERPRQLFQEAQAHLVGGVNSPVRAFRGVGGTPLFIQRGRGSHIWDEDGNEYVDYVLSWGPLILGHANHRVLKAIRKQASLGTTFGAPPAGARGPVVRDYSDREAVNPAFRRAGEEGAAVLVEPVAANMGVVPPAP